MAFDSFEKDRRFKSFFEALGAMTCRLNTSAYQLHLRNMHSVG